VETWWKVDEIEGGGVHSAGFLLETNETQALSCEVGHFEVTEPTKNVVAMSTGSPAKCTVYGESGEPEIMAMVEFRSRSMASNESALDIRRLVGQFIQNATIEQTMNMSMLLPYSRPQRLGVEMDLSGGLDFGVEFDMDSDEMRGTLPWKGLRAIGGFLPPLSTDVGNATFFATVLGETVLSTNILVLDTTGRDVDLVSVTPVSMAFIATTTTLRVAVRAWCSDETVAIDTYGHISSWDTSEVMNMSFLFGGGESQVRSEPRRLQLSGLPLVWLCASNASPARTHSSRLAYHSPLNPNIYRLCYTSELISIS
jgi:hypothetical protein